MSATQRVRQGVRALLNAAQPVDRKLAAAYLTPAQLALFDRLRRSEQLHSLNVLRAVLAQEQAPHDLAVAALLHDVGKARYPFPAWQKTLVVLARAAFPRRYARWAAADADSNRWARPFAISMQHPVWGAELAAAAGASPRAVWLIAHHADPLAAHAGHPYAPLLARLQRADDAN
ncbi:MAG: HD domain-containing protein [Aggregatilineales bacterium]